MDYLVRPRGYPAEPPAPEAETDRRTCLYHRPFPYPGHTHIPLTMEKSCMQLEVVPYDQRKDEVTVLGKLFGELHSFTRALVFITHRVESSRVLLSHQLCSSRLLAFFRECYILDTCCQCTCHENR